MFSRTLRKKICSRKAYCMLLLVSLLYGMAQTFSYVNPRESTLFTSEDKEEVNVDAVLPEHPGGRRLRVRERTARLVPPVFTMATTRMPTTTAGTYDFRGCNSWFEDTFEKNLQVIQKYPKGDADKYMWKIGENISYPLRFMTSFPVIVTAANDEYYEVTHGLLKTIHELLMPIYGDIKIIYYDLGLAVDQLIQLRRHCRCEVRRFPFEQFPAHVKVLDTYTWKPIIVQKLLMEYGWVWWADSSIRFTTSNLDDALRYSRENSLLAFTNGPDLSVARQTDNQTMDYFGEDRCKFRHFGEFESGFNLYYYDRVTMIVVNTWAACALTEACMCPSGTSRKLLCYPELKQDGRCHRFDQSVLSILLRRLYHEQNDYPKVDVPFQIHDIRRNEFVQYFPKSSHNTPLRYLG